LTRTPRASKKRKQKTKDKDKDKRQKAKTKTKDEDEDKDKMNTILKKPNGRQFQNILALEILNNHFSIDSYRKSIQNE